MFTQDDLRAAREIGAPYERLLELAPLWYTPTPGRVLIAHGHKVCPALQVTSRVTPPEQIDARLEFMRDRRNSLGLCSCTMYDAAHMKEEPHPLAQLDHLVVWLRKLQAHRGMDTLDRARDAELLLATTTHHIRQYLGWTNQHPGFSVWADWLSQQLVEQTRTVDTVRAAAAAATSVPVPEYGNATWVLIEWRTANATFGQLAPWQQQAVGGYPIVTRLPGWRAVVRAPRDAVDTSARSRRDGFQLLGPERRMPDEAWDLFDVLTLTHSVQEAFCAASDAADRLNGYDAWQVARSLASAGVAACELVNTALVLAH